MKKLQKLYLILIILLITMILSSNLSLFGNSIVIAAQQNITNIDNIEFDAYFTQNDQIVRKLEANINDIQTLIINIKVNKSGYLDQAKIKISDANFIILKDKVLNNYVKSINVQENEIELNQIIYQNDVKIELPIAFKKQESFSEDYFEKLNSIFIEGIYHDGSEISFQGSINTQVIWKAQTDIELSQEIEKYLKTSDNECLLQQKIITELKDNALPRKEEILEIEVPVLNNKKPEEVIILENGIKSEDVVYNKDTGKVIITNKNKGIWTDSKTEYKIIYNYLDIVFEEQKIDLDTNLTTKLYDERTMRKQSREEQVELKEKGEQISINKLTTDKIYKGYFYANSLNKTIYKEDNQIEISRVKDIPKVEIISDKENFINNLNEEFDIKDKINYTKTMINKFQLAKIIGTQGKLVIEDLKGNILSQVDIETKADESGNIEINYNENIGGIKLSILNPQGEGKIDILNIKEVDSRIGLEREKLRTFDKIVTSTKLIVNEKELISSSNVLLEDTKTEAKIEINNKNLSTLQTNENVQLLITLKSDSEKYDLYKNPNLLLIMPNGVKAKIKNISQLNAKDELEIIDAKESTVEGRQAVSIALQGEQTKYENEIAGGIQISITADIMISKNVPTKTEKIDMYYINENRENEKFYTSEDIKINSKYGVLTVNSISNYNNENENVEAIDNDVKTANLEENEEEIQAQQDIIIVNNYEKEITNVSVIIKNPDFGEESLNDKIIKSNFGLELKEELSKNNNISHIYYSEDTNNENWLETIDDITKIRAIKVDLIDNTIKAGSAINLSYLVGIPEGLKENKITNSIVNLNYTYEGEEYTTNSVIELKTSEHIDDNEEIDKKEETKIVSQLEGMTVEIVEKNAKGVLEENQNVHEGEKIQYKVRLTNNTEESIKNIKIEAVQDNAIFWNHNEYEITNSHTFEKEIVTKYEENQKLEKMLLQLEELNVNETKELEYQITVKNIIENDTQLSGNIKIEADNRETENIEISSRNIEKSPIVLTLKEGFYEQTDIYSDRGFPIEMIVKNNSNIDIENVIVELQLGSKVYFSEDQFEETENVKFIEVRDNIAKFKINKILANETEIIPTQLIVNRIPIEDVKVNSEILFKTNINDTQYYSNQVERVFYQSETLITALQTSDKEVEYLENNDEVTFTITIENKGAIEEEVNINDDVPHAAEIKEAYILVNNEKVDANISEKNNNIYGSLNLKPNESAKLIIKTKIDITKATENVITNYAIINGLDFKVVTNQITYKLIGKEEKRDDAKKEEREEDYKPDDKSDNERNKYSLSGKVWIDSNKNGKIDNNERTLNNVEVMILNADNGNIVKDNNNEIIAVTNNDGIYKFEQLDEGSYIIIFKYDSGKYRVTEYKAQEVSEKDNSDVISKNIELNGQDTDVAMTETVNLNSDINNINAGFIENEKFDLRLDKYINKITIQNNKGTTINEYNNSQLAKVEIDSKQISNSLVTIEYKIIVTNEGELPGYVNEIADYIPSDVTFNTKLNDGWNQESNGNIYSNEFTNELLNPGESKELSLILNKQMNQNNTGTTINIAEISKSSNDFSTVDIDSNPGNKISGEDDMSMAQVIISIRTGMIITYILLIMTLIVTTGVGIYFIKKKVILEK